MSRGTVTVALRSAPFGKDPPDADRYYAAIGRAMVLWGRLELGLDHALLGISVLPGGEAVRQRPDEQVPPTLNQKAKMWRKAFSTLPALATMKPSGLKLIDEIMEAAEDRAIFAHATWQGFVSADPLIMRFRRVRFSRAKPLAFTCDVELSDVLDIQRTFDNLNTRLVPFVWNISVMCNAEPPAAGVTTPASP